jgi:hypothetical protein
VQEARALARLRALQPRLLRAARRPDAGRLEARRAALEARREAACAQRTVSPEPAVRISAELHLLSLMFVLFMASYCSLHHFGPPQESNTVLG